MAFYFFIWSPRIEEHLALHGVCPEEFEQVVLFPQRLERSRSRSDRWIAFGSTSSGRQLACVYELLEDGATVLPVTAFEPD